VFGREPSRVVDEVVVGTGTETVELGGDLSCPLPSCTRSSLVVIAPDTGVGGRAPGAGSRTQISGRQDALETGLRRTRDIFSRHMNPWPILQRSEVDASIGRDTWGSVLSNAGHAISRQHELTVDSKYRSTFFAISYASLLRVIGSRLFIKLMVEIFYRS